VFLFLKPEHALPIIRAPRMSAEYAFWDGKTNELEWRKRFTLSCLTFIERASGVAHIHAHRFRDTFAADLLSQGIPIRYVSRLLGHKNVATTLRYYEHWVREDQDEAIRMLMRKQPANVIEFRKDASA
jgi:integrase